MGAGSHLHGPAASWAAWWPGPQGWSLEDQRAAAHAARPRGVPRPLRPPEVITRLPAGSGRSPRQEHKQVRRAPHNRARGHLPLLPFRVGDTIEVSGDPPKSTHRRGTKSSEEACPGAATSCGSKSHQRRPRCKRPGCRAAAHLQLLVRVLLRVLAALALLAQLLQLGLALVQRVALAPLLRLVLLQCGLRRGRQRASGRAALASPPLGTRVLGAGRARPPVPLRLGEGGDGARGAR